MNTTSQPTAERGRDSRHRSFAWVALALALVAGRTAIATASPGAHAIPATRPLHTVVWVSRTGVVRPKAELASAKPPAAKPAHQPRDERDRSDGNARDGHGPATPDPILVERTSKDHQVLPRLQDRATAVAPALGRPARNGGCALAVARTTPQAAHAASFHDAHAPPRHA
ncbi:MAG TPA: hypothetical protein VGK30_07340 [Candidatus Binatia bacterium]|jgi:hypothetical protein